MSEEIKKEERLEKEFALQISKLDVKKGDVIIVNIDNDSPGRLKYMDTFQRIMDSLKSQFKENNNILIFLPTDVKLSTESRDNLIKRLQKE